MGLDKYRDQYPVHSQILELSNATKEATTTKKMDTPRTSINGNLGGCKVEWVYPS